MEDCSGEGCAAQHCGSAAVPRESRVPLPNSAEGEAPAVMLAVVVSNLWSGQVGHHGRVLPFNLFSI